MMKYSFCANVKYATRPPSTSEAASVDVNHSNKSPPKMLQLFPEHKVRIQIAAPFFPRLNALVACFIKSTSLLFLFLGSRMKTIAWVFFPVISMCMLLVLLSNCNMYGCQTH